MTGRPSDSLRRLSHTARRATSQLKVHGKVVQSMLLDQQDLCA